MKLKLHQNSLFAILARSPWWVSALIAAAVFGGTRYFMPVALAIFAASPFLFIAGYVGWKQLRAPSAAKVAAALEKLAALPREGVVAALEAGWRREGYEVNRPGNAAFDLELKRHGRTSLVACRRLKAKSTGVEPLKELHAAGKDADELIFVAAGEVTEQARAFAFDNRVKIVEGMELVKLARNAPANAGARP
jgi:restriction system protein